LDGRVEPLADAPLDVGQEARRGPAMGEKEKLHAGLGAVTTQLLAIAEQAHDRLNHARHLFDPHERIEAHAEVRPRREAAANAQAIPDLVAPAYRRQPD